VFQGTCLTQLDEFRSYRAEFTAKLAQLKEKVEFQRQYYANKLLSLEEKHERDRQRSVILLLLLMMMLMTMMMMMTMVVVGMVMVVVVVTMIRVQEC